VSGQHARRPRGASVIAEIAAVARRIVERADGEQWPAARWQGDPVGFARTILGVELAPKQIEIVEGVRDHARVAVRGGRKIGKDFACAVLALWWYSSFEDARVIATATTAHQIDSVLYREVRKLFWGSGTCLACRRAAKAAGTRAPSPCPHSVRITGRPGEIARSGIRSPDLREIQGFTARDPEAMAGTSGTRILYILDEASAIPDAIHTAIRGNLAAGGGREVLISNPTRVEGFFFEAFHGRAALYHKIEANSEETPNVLAGREVFPGQASAEWVAEQRQEWGEDSPLYRVHVLGQFVLNEEGAIFSVDSIARAEAAWHDVTPTGRLVVAVDPAGAGGDGDESAFAARRGQKILTLHGRRGLSPEAHVLEALGLIATHGRDTGPDLPLIVVDREGDIGAKVWGAFVGYRESQRQGRRSGDPDAFELTGVRSSERAYRRPETYDRVRDELAASLADWMRDGGGIPQDAKLARELHAMQWYTHISGRTKLTPKTDLRERLGRSPDRFDVICLAVWPRMGGAAAVADAPRHVPIGDAYGAQAERVFDPYAGVDPWGRGAG